MQHLLTNSNNTLIFVNRAFHIKIEKLHMKILTLCYQMIFCSPVVVVKMYFMMFFLIKYSKLPMSLKTDAFVQNNKALLLWLHHLFIEEYYWYNRHATTNKYIVTIFIKYQVYIWNGNARKTICNGNINCDILWTWTNKPTGTEEPDAVSLEKYWRLVLHEPG